MNYWEKILESFSFKSKGGAPDFTNPNDRLLLRMELLKRGWNENAVNELLHGLTEARTKEQEEYLNKINPQDWGNTGRKIKISTALNYQKKNFDKKPYQKVARDNARDFLTKRALASNDEKEKKIAELRESVRKDLEAAGLNPDDFSI